MIQIDMQMPKCCYECFALDENGDYPFCLISQDQRGYTFNTREKRMPTCPLKAHEPHLVTESDFNGEDAYGYIPVWTEEKDGDMYWECIPKVAITDPDGIRVLRYWTSRPDENRRAETPWE